MSTLVEVSLSVPWAPVRSGRFWKVSHVMLHLLIKLVHKNVMFTAHKNTLKMDEGLKCKTQNQKLLEDAAGKL